ncbi:MAG TPA: glutamate dehydrogenase, partial [Allosphingosinicella sp.]|nr:glutamate dehydrogenase [Allosphingosinicella sp.]
MNSDDVAVSEAASSASGGGGTGAHAAADGPIVEAIAAQLVRGALPGEVFEFGDSDRREAARFIAACAAKREAGAASVRLETLGGALGQRRMRIGIINDDMPFLVDSVANTLAARGLIVHRLLHPVVCVRRDEDGALEAVEPLCDERDRRESMMYLEVDRAEARIRREVVSDLNRVLADVRAAVTDWRAMQARMRADADAAEGEGADLLRWFAGGAMTLLGYEVERPDGPASGALGLFRLPGDPTDPGGSVGAIRYFEGGGSVPLLAKAERRASVHRRVPLDLVVVPIREGDKVTSIGVHAGLWTSEALSSQVEDVPVLRARLKQLEEEFGFDPSGHSGKALRHAVTALPHDLLIGLSMESVRELVTTAMSLADRPRPTLVLVRSVLKGNMFAFVWLPRDELTTRRRLAIGEMIEQASGGRISNWSVELGDGDLALIRYTLYVGPATPTPDVAELDRRLDAMVRGWEPAVEEALGEVVGPARATRLALSYMDDLPELYRARTSPEEASRDILRICELDGAAARDARLYRDEADGPTRLRLKTYRLAGLIPLSEAVPVFENFGFRVLEEFPSPLDDGKLGYIHEFVLEMRVGDAEDVLVRAGTIERAIAEVLEGKAENDAFNQLLVAAALDPADVILFRA